MSDVRVRVWDNARGRLVEDAKFVDIPFRIRESHVNSHGSERPFCRDRS